MRIKEQLYLDAKFAYYNGTPIMSDYQFDLLENELKLNGSTVIKQIGYKISDYDYPHPSKMGSLDKIQTVFEDNKFNDFKDWLDKINNSKKYLDASKLVATPKYDGNSVNVIYLYGQLHKILTRGDGTYGKDVTEKLRNRINFNFEIPKDGIVEVRCEAIIPTNIFNKIYSKNFANSRNLVAGLLGRDNFIEDDINNINLVPLNVLLNNNHYETDLGTYLYQFNTNEYDNMYEHFRLLRDNFEYQLDGIVIAFKTDFRDEIGDGDRNPKWAIAIKFIPEEAITDITEIEWSIGKTGELTPIANINPVQLAGTTVSKASIYNYGFYIDNKVGVGAKISIIKSGDIIPKVQRVILASNNFITDDFLCPECGSETYLDDIHLMCSNKNCVGIWVSKILYSTRALKLKGIGKSLIKSLKDKESIKNGAEWLIYCKSNLKNRDVFGFSDTQTKSYENFVILIDSIKSLTTQQLILLLNHDDIGDKIALQLANYVDSIEPDFTGVSSIFKSEEFLTSLKEDVDLYSKLFNNVGIEIIQTKKLSDDIVMVEMTGSPKSFGFKTKSDWLDTFNGKVVTGSLTDKRCKFLVTDDLDSDSSKMKKAKKLNIQIVTYNEIDKIFQ